MSDKMRKIIVFSGLGVLCIGIVLAFTTQRIELWLPVVIASNVIAMIALLVKKKDDINDMMQSEIENRITKIRILIALRYVFFLIAVILGVLVECNLYIVGLFIGLSFVCWILSSVFDLQNQKHESAFYYTIITDMEYTEENMSVNGKVVYDQEIISKIKQFVTMRKNYVNFGDKDGKTMLMHAASNGRTEVVRYLLEIGADAKIKNLDYFSALHAGVMSKNVEIVRMILEAGAEVNGKWNLGNSPIMLADCTTDLEIFRLLMAYGADPNQQNQFGVSAMDMFANSPEILEILNQR